MVMERLGLIISSMLELDDELYANKMISVINKIFEIARGAIMTLLIFSIFHSLNKVNTIKHIIMNIKKVVSSIRLGLIKSITLD